MKPRKYLFLNCFLGFLILPWFYNEIFSNQLIVGSELDINKDTNKYSNNLEDNTYILGSGDVLFIKFE